MQTVSDSFDAQSSIKTVTRLLRENRAEEMRAFLDSTSSEVRAVLLADSSNICRKWMTYWASKYRNANALAELLRWGMPTNSLCPMHCGSVLVHVTCAFLAAHEGYVDTLKVYLDAGASDKERCPKCGETMLLTCARNDRETCFELLRFRGADPKTERTRTGRTALMLASRGDSFRIAKKLLAEDSGDIGTTDMHGNGTLHFVRSLQMANLLIARGAVPLENNFGVTPAMQAARRGNEGVTSLLLRMTPESKRPATLLLAMACRGVREARYILLRETLRSNENPFHPSGPSLPCGQSLPLGPMRRIESALVCHARFREPRNAEEVRLLTEADLDAYGLLITERYLGCTSTEIEMDTTNVFRNLVKRNQISAALEVVQAVIEGIVTESTGNCACGHFARKSTNQFVKLCENIEMLLRYQVKLAVQPAVTMAPLAVKLFEASVFLCKVNPEWRVALNVFSLYTVLALACVSQKLLSHPEVRKAFYALYCESYTSHRVFNLREGGWRAQMHIGESDKMKKGENARMHEVDTNSHGEGLEGAEDVVEGNKQVVENGAHMVERDEENDDGLDDDEERGDVLLLHYLLRHGARMYVAEIDGTAGAVDEMTAALLDFGVDANRQDSLGVTALKIALSRPHFFESTIKRLLERTRELDTFAADGKTSLESLSSLEYVRKEEIIRRISLQCIAARACGNVPASVVKKFLPRPLVNFVHRHVRNSS